MREPVLHEYDMNRRKISGFFLMSICEIALDHSFRVKRAGTVSLYFLASLRGKKSVLLNSHISKSTKCLCENVFISYESPGPWLIFNALFYIAALAANYGEL